MNIIGLEKLINEGPIDDDIKIILKKICKYIKNNNAFKNSIKKSKKVKKN